MNSSKLRIHQAMLQKHLAHKWMKWNIEQMQKKYKISIKLRDNCKKNC